MIASTQTNHPLAEIKAADPAQTPLEQACSRLKTAGLRITQPRVAILEALIKKPQPASIEQIHADLPDASCDLVTVYRCLAAFEELNLVRRCFFHNGTSLYQIDLGGEPTYHVVCKANNTVEPLAPEVAAELRAALTKVEDTLRAQGYSDVSHMVEFFATAPRAARASTSAEMPSVPLV